MRCASARVAASSCLRRSIGMSPSSIQPNAISVCCACDKAIFACSTSIASVWPRRASMISISRSISSDVPIPA